MPEAADLLITGTRVRTMDPRAPIACALAARGGRIVAVGDDAEILARRGPQSEVIDGRGRVVVPVWSTPTATRCGGRGRCATPT